MTPSLRARCIAALALLTLQAGSPAAQAPNRSNAFDEQVDALVREGFERPAQALLALGAIPGTASPSAEDRVSVLLAMGIIEAQSGGAVRAGALADRLLAFDDAAGRAVAAANLVRASVAEHAGRLDVAAALARAAMPAFQAGCPAGPAAVAAAAATALAVPCDYRSAWRALRIIERRAGSQGLPANATAHAQSALALAEWAGDTRRRMASLASLAQYDQARGERESAQRRLAQVKRLATQTGDLIEQARATAVEARIARAQGDWHGTVALLEEAVALAAEAQAPRLAAEHLADLSDAYAHLGRSADALRAAERALPVAQRHGDQGVERVLINNAGLAKIGLGRVSEGKHDLTRLLELWDQSGENGRKLSTLQEFGEALAAAGDARGALGLYHREQALNTEVMRADRVIALKELQTRNDAEARRRDIELLARDNALKTEALANRDLLQRIWWQLAGVMTLACLLVTVFYRRVRKTNHRLEASRLRLQTQSERDPLTNLANRRHFHAEMTRLCGQGGFEGALLLVDIDHFKHINDAHGHAAGDEVLVEVARRLNEAVRSDDLVVRWGGEEFLILAPRAAGEQADQMAARVLRTLGESPIMIGERAEAHALRVTASIGYARFPLPPHGADVPWEQAVNLADMALYSAKKKGRNRAVGIASSTASTREALQDVEADFDRALHTGQVTLLQSPGPEPHDTMHVA